MGQEFDTEHLARFVSDMLGWRVNVVLGDYRNMPDGYLGLANWEMIQLRSSLLRNMDPILPRVFLHELGHIVLHKRDMDNKEEIPQPEREKEAELFASHMLMRLGESFVWDALQGNLSYDEERRAKAELMTFADSKIFRRNQVKQTYERGSQGDVEIKWRRQPQASVHHHRRQMTATELETQGRRELALAAKVSNPTVAAMIRTSGQQKLGQTATNGRRSEGNVSGTPYERATHWR